MSNDLDLTSRRHVHRARDTNTAGAQAASHTKILGQERIDLLDLGAHELAEVRLVLPDVLEGVFVIQDHHGLGMRVTWRLYGLAQELLAVQQGVGVALDLAGFPAQLDDEPLQLPPCCGVVSRAPPGELITACCGVFEVSRTKDAARRFKQVWLEPL